MGRVLAGIIADTCGWHDPFGGVLNAAEVKENMVRGVIRICVTVFPQRRR
jgi:hypothetical protein